MGYKDVAFLPSRASFSTTFLKICGRGENLWTAACHKAVEGLSKDMLPCKHFCSTKPLFCVSQISWRS